MPKSMAAIFILCAALCGCTVWGERPAKELSDAVGGESLERAFWREVKNQHWNDVERRLATNFVAVTPTGQLDRTATLDYLKQLKLRDYSLGDLRTELNGDTFVVLYAITLQGSSNGQALTEPPQHMMSVWQQQKSGWVQIAHTTLGPEGK